MTDILVNSDELIAEALTFYASDLREQAEFAAYCMNTDRMQECRDKVGVIEELLLAHDRMNTIKAAPTVEASPTYPVPGDEPGAPVEAKHPIGFTSQKVKPQASPKNPRPIVGLPKTSWDVV